MSQPEEGALYKVNKHITPVIIATALLGIPMLCSFVFARWQLFRIPSLVLVVCCFYLNNLYPDRVMVEPDCLNVKFFLRNDWVAIPYNTLRLKQEENALVLVREKGSNIRFSMKELSVRLYNQLAENIQPVDVAQPEENREDPDASL